MTDTPKPDPSVGKCPDCGASIFAEHTRHACATWEQSGEDGRFIASFSFQSDSLIYKRRNRLPPSTP